MFTVLRVRNLDTLRMVCLCSLTSEALDGESSHKYLGVAQTAREWSHLRSSSLTHGECGLRRLETRHSWDQSSDIQPLHAAWASSQHSDWVQKGGVLREGIQKPSFLRELDKSTWPFLSQLYVYIPGLKEKNSIFRRMHLDLEVMQHHFCHILSGRSESQRPDSGRGHLYATSWWENGSVT